MTASSAPRRHFWLEILLLLGIIVLGAALRIYQIEGPALWADEGNNAYFAHQTLPELLRMSRLTHDTDPPMHRLALRLWLALWGDGALQLRMLSVVCNLLTLPLIWLWARRLGGPKAGLTAALLFALHPMAAYFGREAKGYPFATLFLTAQSLIWCEALRLKRAPSRLLWLVATLCAFLALSAHYYVILMFAAQGAVMLVNARPGQSDEAQRQARRILGWWMASMALTALAVLPWVWLTFGTAAGGALGLSPGRESWTPPQFLLEVGLTLSGGPVPRNLYRMPALAALACLVAAAVWRGPREARWTAALLVIPFALALPMQMAVPFFATRFLYYLLAPLAVLGAIGLGRLGRTGWPVLASLVLGWGLSLSGIYAPFTTVAHDLRPMAEALEQRAEPGEKLVMGYIWQEGILRSYAPDVAIEYVLGWYHPDEVATYVSHMLQDSQRLWLLSYGVPAQHADNKPGYWLERNSARAWSMQYQTHHLALYMPIATCPSIAQDSFAWQGITMDACAWPLELAPGDWLRVPIIWQVADPPLQPVVVFCHLVDEQGALITQQDGAPRNGTRLFREMGPAEQVTESRLIQIPYVAKPGTYTLRVGLYRPRTRERMTPLQGDTDGDQAVIVARIQVRGE